MLRIARESDLVIRVDHRPGDFIAQNSGLVQLWPEERVDDELVERVSEAFILGSQRLRTQDVEFAITQLVEIAVRALSPSTNDPFVAIAAIDQLGAALSNLAERSIPSAYRYDDEGKLRMIVKSFTFAGVTNTAFDMIRQNSRDNPPVTIRLLETIAIVAHQTHTGEARRALRRQAEMTYRCSMQAVPEEEDRRDIQERFDIVLDLLEEKEGL